jgi:hypothetical protein
MLIAKAANFHRHRLGQLAGKISDVNARAAVNVWRIFIGQKEDFQARKEFNGEARMSNDELMTIFK